MQTNSILSFIAMGSNASDNLDYSYQYLLEAEKHLQARQIEFHRKSRYYKTPAFPKGNGDDFINNVIAIKTKLCVDELLDCLHDVEHKLGRVRRKRWGARVIDIDLLVYGDLVLPNLKTYKFWRDLPLNQQMLNAPKELILPHPRLQERSFVLLPLRDVALNWRHPVSGKNCDEMLRELPEDSCKDITIYCV